MACWEEKLQVVCRQEEERIDFIKELIKQVQDLTDERTKAQDDLELSQYLCKKQGEDLKSARHEVQSLQKSMHCDPFVLVLIDGDITMVRFPIALAEILA